MQNFKKYINKVVSVIVTYREAPIKGRMTDLNPDFVEIERLSGDTATIRLTAILGIHEGRDARTVV